MRVFLYILFLTFLMFGQTRYYLPERIVASNNRAINDATVKLYVAGTLTHRATLAYAKNTPGDYYWTGGTATVPWGDYDIYVNFTPTSLADTARAYKTQVSIRNGYTITAISRDTITAVLSDSAYTIDPIAGTGVLATADHIGYLDSIGIREYIKLGKTLTPAHFGVNPDSGAPLPGFSTADRIRAARWNTRRYQDFLDFCYSPDSSYSRQDAKLSPAKIYVAPQTPGTGLQYCLNIRGSFSIEGTGTGRFGNGTQFILVDSVSAIGDTIVVLATNGFIDKYIEEVVIDRFWHESKVEGIYINCNGTNQAGGQQWGIGIVNPGETSFLGEIFIGNFVGRGITYELPAPNFSIYQTSVFPASRASHDFRDYERIGFYHLNGGGTFITTSGDECSPLHYITGGGRGSYSFINTKVEELGLFQNQQCFWLENTEEWVALDIIGGRLDKNTTDTTGTLIRVEVQNSGELPYSVNKTATKNSGFPNLLVESIDGGVTFDTLFTSPKKVGGVFGKVSANNSNNFHYGASNDLYYRRNLSFRTKGTAINLMSLATDADTTNILAYSPSTKTLALKSAGTDITLSDLNNNVLLNLDSTLVKTNFFTRLEGGLRIGNAGAVTIDTLKKSSVLDSLQIKIQGLGWFAFPILPSQGQ